MTEGPARYVSGLHVNVVETSKTPTQSRRQVPDQGGEIGAPRACYRQLFSAAAKDQQELLLI